MKKHSVLSFIFAIVLLLSVCMLAVSCNNDKEQAPSGTTAVSSGENTGSTTEETQTGDPAPEEDESSYPDSPVNADHDDIAEDDF